MWKSLSLRRPVFLVGQRHLNMKKLTIQTLKNPHVQQLLEQQQKKREKRSTLDRLIEKRTSEYETYFSQSTCRVVQRPTHVSYDHVGQKRALHLSKILRSFVSERIGSGEIGDVLSTKNFQLTNIVVPVDLNRIEILWWSPENEVEQIEELLRGASDELRTAIRHAQLLPNLPPVIFKRDRSPSEREKINQLLDSADKGADGLEVPPVAERTDLYDSDRTVLLRKLSNPSVSEGDITNDDNEETAGVNQLSIDELQRRMKAFALTKRMKRIEKQRSAVDGLIAIERERKDREEFSSNKSSTDQ